MWESPENWGRIDVKVNWHSNATVYSLILIQCAYSPQVFQFHSQIHWKSLTNSWDFQSVPRYLLCIQNTRVLLKTKKFFNSFPFWYANVQHEWQKMFLELLDFFCSRYHFCDVCAHQHWSLLMKKVLFHLILS